MALADDIRKHKDKGADLLAKGKLDPALAPPVPASPVVTPQIEINNGIVTDVLPAELEPVDTPSIGVPLVQWTDRPGEPRRG